MGSKYSNMRILITNDDGVNSSGIMAAKKAVENLGNIDVVAPATYKELISLDSRILVFKLFINS